MEWLVLGVPVFLLKVGAYTLAGHYLLRVYKVEGSAFVFGLVRAITGLALGGLALWLLQPKFGEGYASLVLIHFVAWSTCIAAFFGRGGEDWSKVVFGAVLGTVFSMILDVPSFLAAIPLLARTC
jgi:hypothetical protein